MRETSYLSNGKNFSQGSIFCGLKNSNGLSTLGVIITARCDIEHNKVDKIVCLPIYSLDMWMKLYGNDDFYKKTVKSVIAQFDNIAKKYQLNYDACRTFGIDEFIHKLTPKCNNSSDIERIKSLHDFISNKNFSSNLKTIKESKRKYFDSIFSNQKSNIHFLESLKGFEQHDGFIFDFSEPISISATAIKDIANELVYQKYNRSKDELYRNIMLSPNEKAFFTCTIRSPYIEQILQRFSQFYARIGTEDIPESTYNKIMEVYCAF